MTSSRTPRLVSPGDHVAVLSLSGPSDPDAIARGAERIASRYRVSIDPRARGRAGFLAGDDDQRAASLMDALEDSSVSALFCARGGYGATRVLERHGAKIADALCANPKPIVGFSDTTALHVLWQRCGVRSIHGPMVARMGSSDLVSDADLHALFAALEGHTHPLRSEPTRGASACDGVARGGNLAVLASLVGTPFAPSFAGAIVFLEDVGERPYRVDRMLTQLRAAGCFDGARAFVIGEFVDCAPGPDGVSVEQVIEERLGSLGAPVFVRAPFGHGASCAPIALGANASIDAHGTVRFDPELCYDAAPRRTP
ncbi:MAG: LD-carboxypeptidase [Myxococcales bacterium]|nr:LD-carboxypeptidase [Myxococcales bacterium]